MTYRFDSRQHADVSGEVRGLENGLVLPPEVQVHHQRLELLSNDPRFVFQIPSEENRSVRRRSHKTLKTVDPGGEDRLTP